VQLLHRQLAWLLQLVQKALRLAAQGKPLLLQPQQRPALLPAGLLQLALLAEQLLPLAVQPLHLQMLAQQQALPPLPPPQHPSACSPVLLLPG
jgi:hypothetical protein